MALITAGCGARLLRRPRKCWLVEVRLYGHQPLPALCGMRPDLSITLAAVDTITETSSIEALGGLPTPQKPDYRSQMQAPKCRYRRQSAGPQLATRKLLLWSDATDKAAHRWTLDEFAPET